MNKECGRYKFQFRWSCPTNTKSKGLDMMMQTGTTLYYSGLCLMHRQMPIGDVSTTKNTNFINYSMYHNKRLFNSINKSINR